MKPTDRPKFIEIVLGFAELKGKQLSAPALELYWRAMQAWSIEDFTVAAEQLLRTSEFFPTPDKLEALRRAGRPTAGEAFARALTHAASSAYRDGPLGDALIDRAARALGGYRVLAMAEDHQLQFLERRFSEHFESIQDAEDIREAVPQLTHKPHGKALSGPQSLGTLLARSAIEEWEPS